MAPRKKSESKVEAPTPAPIPNEETATLAAELIIGRGLKQFCEMLNSIQPGDPTTERPQTTHLKALRYGTGAGPTEFFRLVRALPGATERGEARYQLSDGRILVAEIPPAQYNKKTVK